MKGRGDEARLPLPSRKLCLYQERITVGVTPACYLARSSLEWCDGEVMHGRKRVDIDRQSRTLAREVMEDVAGARALM